MAGKRKGKRGKLSRRTCRSRRNGGCNMETSMQANEVSIQTPARPSCIAARSTVSACCWRTAASRGRCTKLGEVFRSLFQRAALDRVRTMALIRIPGGAPDLLTESQAVAREKIAHAVDTLGGFGSPAGSIAWYVIGLEHTIRDWSLRQGWNGRSMNPAQAQGVLVGALGALAVHFGLVRRSRAASSATPFLSLPALEEKSSRA